MNAKVSLAFDFLDPWGWIAERRLRLAMLNAQVLLPITYQPCRTALSKTAVGQAYHDYLERRFGNQAKVNEERVIEAASRLGLPLQKLNVKVLPDPQLAMLALTAEQEHAPALFDAIYAAIYRDGRDVADPMIVTDLLKQAKSTNCSAQHMAENNGLLNELQTRERAVAQWCNNLTPSIRVGEVVVPGAQPPSVLAHLLKNLSLRQAIQLSRDGSTTSPVSFPGNGIR